MMLLGDDAPAGEAPDGPQAELAGVLLAAARAGGPARRFLLRGGPGSGKSWVLDRFVRGLPAETLLLTCAGHPAETRLPFAGLHELVSGLPLDALPPTQQQALGRAIGGEPGEPEDALAVSAGLLTLVTDEARSRPVVIVVDDADWLDKSTRSSLLFLARRLDRDAVTIVAATRSVAAGDDGGFGRARFESLHLERLTPAEGRALLRRRFPELSSLVAHRLLERADGLPLALAQLPAELSPAERAGTAPLPENRLGASIGSLYTARLGRLGRAGRLALLITSLDALTTPELARALAEAGLTLPDLDRALASGLAVETAAGIRPAHPTVLPAVEAAVPRTDRERALRGVIAALASDRGRQAAHLDAVTTGTDEVVAGALQEAAEQAWQRGAYAESARWWVASAARTPVPERAHARLSDALPPLLRCGAGAETIAVIDRLSAEATTPAERARFLTQRLVAELFTHTTPTPTPVVVVAARAVAAEAPSAAFHLLASSAYIETTAGRVRSAKALADLARTLVPTAESGLTDRLVLETIDDLSGEEAADALLTSDWDGGLSDAELCDPAVPLPLILNHLVWTGGSIVVDRILARQRDALERGGYLSLLGLCDGLRVLLPVLRGDWGDALARFDRVERLLLDTDFTGPLPYIQLQHAGLLAARGEEDACRALVDRAVPAPTEATPIHRYARLCILGRLALTSGSTEEAASLLLAAADTQSELGMVEPGFFDSFGDLFEAFWRLRRGAELLDRLDTLHDHAEATDRHSALAVALRCRGLEADPDDVDALFARSLAEHAVDPNAFETARTELSHGQKLRRVRRKRDAREPLHRALTTFEALGAGPWAALARAELAACGERRATAAAPGILDALTPQEWAVAQAVADGLSNRETASRLFLSVRTVEYHLANAYRKLAVSSRGELASRLAAELAPAPGERRITPR
ncbi:helix-turn-helix transcriptional regulator [Leifsonia poae]|uniref:helix-turn-helix transcriptional regulator n=1 Tax=Leifsonia poae TaxID=110933 RepID=UPI001CBD9906|nr:LuxR family transcriptional regulator [Leifsonia poae]